MKPGTLVYVARPMRCGCLGNSLGMVFVMPQPSTSSVHGRHKSGCGKRTYPPGTLTIPSPTGNGARVEVARLKPLKGGEEVRREKRMEVA